MSTDNSTSVQKIISRLMAVYGFHKPKQAADLLGVSSQRLNNWISRNSTAAIDKIKEVVPEEKQEWVLTGKKTQMNGWLPIFDTLLAEFRELPTEEQYRVVADLIEKGKEIRKKKGKD